MRSLSWKIAGALLLVVIISIGIMAFLTNRNTTTQFQSYLAQGGMMYSQRLADNLGEYYHRSESWSGIQPVLETLVKSEDERLVLADASGTVVGDTGEDWLGKSSTELQLSGGIPVYSSGRLTGILFVYTSGIQGGHGHMGGRGMMGNNQTAVMAAVDTTFLNRINSYLWVAGLIALAAALLLGLILARQITHPLRVLTAGAGEIARGNLSHRVKIKTRDEIGALADSFNSMASSLEKSEQSRKQLISDVSHELRTPLTIIEGTVDGILDGVFPADREHLQSIKEQTALLTHLTGDLRDLSLAESGNLKLELTQVNITELIQRKLAQFSPQALEKKVQLTFDSNPGIPEIYVDSRRLEQVVVNLLSNAVRHTPPGGQITARVTFTDFEPHLKQAGLIISVADTGEGIPPEHLPRIFDRFYRVENSRSRSEGGVGLGLSIVKQMVMAHGGHVWAESQPGKGSTFYIALPLKRSK